MNFNIERPNGPFSPFLCRFLRNILCNLETCTGSVIYDETMDTYIAQHYAVQFCQCFNFTKKKKKPKKNNRIGERSLS